MSLLYNCVHFTSIFLPLWDKNEPKRNILHRHTVCYHLKSRISEYKDIYLKSSLLSKAYHISTGSGNLEFLELKYLKNVFSDYLTDIHYSDLLDLNLWSWTRSISEPKVIISQNPYRVLITPSYISQCSYHIFP